MGNYLILGGSSGIGLSIAERLSKEHNIVIVGSSKEKLIKANEKLDKERCSIFQYDLNNVEHVGDIFSYLNENKIVLDGMVYCAGIAPLCLLKDNTPELMERVYNINVFSFIECCKYFYMEQNSIIGAKIVAISSVTAHKSGYRQILYGSSKAAMIAAARLMSKELLNRNIRINCISPGVAETEMLNGLRKESENLDERIKRTQPLGVIPPDKIAEAAEMLLSPLSDYITGTELIYDAGLL